MTHRCLRCCRPRAARWGHLVVVLGAVGFAGCAAEDGDPAAEAVARDEVAAVVARQLPGASQESRACVADRLAADGVEPERLERFLGEEEPTEADERPGADVAVELSVATARAVCLTVEELLADG